MKKKWMKLFSIVALSLAVTACGAAKQESSETKTGTAAQSEKASEGQTEKAASASTESDSFTYIIDGDTGNTLNPLTADDRYGLMTTHALYAPPYHIYGDGTIDYILAESMTPSEDGLTLTMKLKDGLKWSDGEPLTADDIVFTYDSINKISKNLYIGDDPITTEKQDDRTVLFHLPSVSASAMEMLSDEISIIPKHIFEGKENADISLLDDKVVGCGPYTFEEYKTGEYLKFKANPNYVKGKPYIDTLIYRIIEKSDTATLAMQSGEGDTLVLTPDMIEQYKGKDGFTLYNYSEGRVPYVRLNVNADTMKDKNYREGILKALNRDEIMRAAYGDKDYYELGYSFLPYDNKYYTDDVEKWDQDIEKAKELTKGGAKSLKLAYVTNNGVLEREGLAIQSELKQVGIDVELVGITDVAYSKMSREKGNKEYDIVLGGYVMGTDPDTFAMLFSSQKDNSMSFSNAEIDKLFEEGNATLDDTKRMEIYKKVQRLVSEEAIYYPLGTNLRTIVTKSNVDPEEAKLVPIYTYGDLSKLKFK